MQPGSIMAVFIVVYPAVLSIIAYLVTKDIRLLYTHKLPAVALLSYLVVMGFGLADSYKLFYSGKPTDDPTGYLIRVGRAYLTVPVMVALAYYLSPLFGITPPWPALPLGILAFAFVRRRLRSPLKEEQR